MKGKGHYIIWLAKIFRYITPFLIVIASCLWAFVLYIPGDGGWKHLGAAVFYLALLFLIPLDLLIRVMVKNSALWIWAIEIIILLVLMLFFI